MIIIIGIAGAGKTTQGKILAQKLGVEWLSVGQLLRNNVSDKFAKEMLAGQIIDDDILLPLLETEFKRIGADKNEMVLDGSPRTMRQAEWLVEKIKKSEIKSTAVIHLKASRSTVKKRLLQRGRVDDTEAAISKRFEEYDKSIVPIIEYWKKQNLPVFEINGEGPVDKDSEAIAKALKL